VSDHTSSSAQRTVLAASDDERTSHDRHASQELASSSSKPTSINENSKNALAIIHDQMVALAKNKESYPEARGLALELLMRPDLPLAIRVRAHIILACGKHDYVHHAQETVRLAEKDLEMFGPGSTPMARAAVEGLLRRARESLRRTERDSAECQRIRAGVGGWIHQEGKGRKDHVRRCLSYGSTMFVSNDNVLTHILQSTTLKPTPSPTARNLIVKNLTARNPTKVLKRPTPNAAVILVIARRS
jgi:hypothetical protein